MTTQDRQKDEKERRSRKRGGERGEEDDKDMWKMKKRTWTKVMKTTTTNENKERLINENKTKDPCPVYINAIKTETRSKNEEVKRDIKEGVEKCLKMAMKREQNHAVLESKTLKIYSGGL